MHALERLITNRTTIIIAHRLSTIRNVDRIILLQDGTVVEQGSHTELMGHSGAYMKLVKMYGRGETK